MALLTYVARALDGLVLAESTQNVVGEAPAQAKREAVRLLRNLHSVPRSCSVATAGQCVFHFRISEGICYLALFHAVYPPKFAFTYLDELHALFYEGELKMRFGTGSVDYRSQIDTIEKPYFFQRFEKQIGRKTEEFRDPGSSHAIRKLHAGLAEVSCTMRSSIDELLQRGEALEVVAGKAATLNAASAEFAGASATLSFRLLLQRYGAMLLLLALVATACICLGDLRTAGGVVLGVICGYFIVSTLTGRWKKCAGLFSRKAANAMAVQLAQSFSLTDQHMDGVL
eukprot:TRINITY_DN112889_c0_g1_i1.p1 TRINITY_DN112889_c0_g1~~TRINITY_DN112889_c0_g1_i1.p1  ORF type:complete len:309 (+),score=75.88 TRINITY_DN112889_c0_g1_i1:74-928(+)